MLVPDNKPFTLYIRNPCNGYRILMIQTIKHSKSKASWVHNYKKKITSSNNYYA